MADTELLAPTLTLEDRRAVSRHLDLLAATHGIFDLMVVVDAAGVIVTSSTSGPCLDTPIGTSWQPCSEYRLDFSAMEASWGRSLVGDFPDEAQWVERALRNDVDEHGIVGTRPGETALMTSLWSNWWTQRYDADPVGLVRLRYLDYLRFAAPVLADDGSVIGAVCLLMPWRHFQRNVLDEFLVDPLLVSMAPQHQYAFVWDTERREVVGVRSENLGRWWPTFSEDTVAMAAGGRTTLGPPDVQHVRALQRAILADDYYYYDYDGSEDTLPYGATGGEVQFLAAGRRESSLFGFGWFVAVGSVEDPLSLPSRPLWLWNLVVGALSPVLASAGGVWLYRRYLKNRP